MLRIAFHANQLSERGGEVALYDYCHYNEALLGNRSVVFYPRQATSNDASVVARFAQSFELVAYDHFAEVDRSIQAMQLDLFYAIKGGEIDGIVSRVVPSMVHAVFAQSPFEIHGSAYAFVSEWLSSKCSAGLVPAVPHVVQAPPLGLLPNLRVELGIPEGAVVLGGYGGSQSFDLDFVRDLVIPEALARRQDVYFVFMNFRPFIHHPRVFFLERSTDPVVKHSLIAACDAMLHARRQGESFGLACAEFSMQGKPVFTYGLSPDRHHLKVLGRSAVVYRDGAQLLQQLLGFQPGSLSLAEAEGYRKYTPEHVMELFDRHLIHPALHRGAMGLRISLATLPWRRPFSPLLRGLFWQLQIAVRRLGKLVRIDWTAGQR
jgi:hypothetical protein